MWNSYIENLTDNQLFTATVADFAGGDPLIYREPQRTEISDLKQLNGKYINKHVNLLYCSTWN